MYLPTKNPPLPLFLLSTLKITMFSLLPLPVPERAERSVSGSRRSGSRSGSLWVSGSDKWREVGQLQTKKGGSLKEAPATFWGEKISEQTKWDSRWGEHYFNLETQSPRRKLNEGSRCVGRRGQPLKLEQGLWDTGVHCASSTLLFFYLFYLCFICLIYNLYYIYYYIIFKFYLLYHTPLSRNHHPVVHVCESFFFFCSVPPSSNIPPQPLAVICPPPVSLSLFCLLVQANSTFFWPHWQKGFSFLPIILNLDREKFGLEVRPELMEKYEQNHPQIFHLFPILD